MLNILCMHKHAQYMQKKYAKCYLLSKKMCQICQNRPLTLAESYFFPPICNMPRTWKHAQTWNKPEQPWHISVSNLCSLVCKPWLKYTKFAPAILLPWFSTLRRRLERFSDQFRLCPRPESPSGWAPGAKKSWHRDPAASLCLAAGDSRRIIRRRRQASVRLRTRPPSRVMSSAWARRAW